MTMHKTTDNRGKQGKYHHMETFASLTSSSHQSSSRSGNMWVAVRMLFDLRRPSETSPACEQHW